MGSATGLRRSPSCARPATLGLCNCSSTSIALPICRAWRPSMELRREKFQRVEIDRFGPFTIWGFASEGMAANWEPLFTQFAAKGQEAGSQALWAAFYTLKDAGLIEIVSYLVDGLSAGSMPIHPYAFPGTGEPEERAVQEAAHAAGLTHGPRLQAGRCRGTHQDGQMAVSCSVSRARRADDRDRPPRSIARTPSAPPHGAPTSLLTATRTHEFFQFLDNPKRNQLLGCYNKEETTIEQGLNKEFQRSSRTAALAPARICGGLPRKDRVMIPPRCTGLRSYWLRSAERYGHLMPSKAVVEAPEGTVNAERYTLLPWKVGAALSTPFLHRGANRSDAE